MTGEQLAAERDYRISMSIAKSMFRQGLLTKQEYNKIDTILLEEYQPILGSLQV